MVGRCGCVLGLRARPLGTDILLRCVRELAAAGVPVDGVKRPLGPITGTPNRPARRRTHRPLGPGDDGDGHLEGEVWTGRDHRPLRVTPAVAVKARIRAFDGGV
jgi:hypothetical protein